MLKNKKYEQGFTLVELAIVLVIVGLLIGGILKGQQLMENASITATVAQIKAVESATTSFLDSYGALPGDLLDSDSKIPGCTTPKCGQDAALKKYKFGDGIIGNPQWNLTAYQPGNVVNTADTSAPTVDQGFETLLFWYSLQKAGLINAVKDGCIDNTPQAFGVTIPQAEVSGGFWVGYTDSDSTRGTTPAAKLPDFAGTPYSILGTVLALVGSPASGITTGTHDANAVTASVAAAIDRKMDDGSPSSGYVQALGKSETAANDTTACVSGTAATMLYNESNPALDCGVYVNIVPQN